jgi:ADP-ribosylglycohydrolase
VQKRVRRQTRQNVPFGIGWSGLSPNKEHDIKSSSFTVDTLEAAARSFLATATYEEAVVRAANLGDDADTVATVCGALAGAYYGYAAIPERWRHQAQDEARIHKIALALGGFADETGSRPN